MGTVTPSRCGSLTASCTSATSATGATTARATRISTRRREDARPGRRRRRAGRQRRVERGGAEQDEREHPQPRRERAVDQLAERERRYLDTGGGRHPGDHGQGQQPDGTGGRPGAQHQPEHGGEQQQGPHRQQHHHRERVRAGRQHRLDDQRERHQEHRQRDHGGVQQVRPLPATTQVGQERHPGDQQRVSQQGGQQGVAPDDGELAGADHGERGGDRTPAADHGAGRDQPPAQRLVRSQPADADHHGGAGQQGQRGTQNRGRYRGVKAPATANPPASTRYVQNSRRRTSQR